MMSTREAPITGFIGSIPIPCRFFYDSDRPFELLVYFPDHNERWVMSRDLFHQAANTGAAGEGDVRIKYDGAVYLLHLTSPDGSVSIEYRAGDIEQFMYNVYETVPPGQEMQHIDMDTEISRLLGE